MLGTEKDPQTSECIKSKGHYEIEVFLLKGKAGCLDCLHAKQSKIFS